jgi:hypothetical protein
MIVAFAIATNVKQEAMAFVLGSDVYHVELQLSDGRSAASWQYQGVGFKTTKASGLWIRYQLPDAMEAKVIRWFEINKRKPYNWAGIFGGMIAQLDITGIGYNCADATYTALRYAGLPIPLVADVECVTPDILRKMIENLGFKKLEK